MKLVALWDECGLINSYDPKYIVIPKPVYDNERLLRWKAGGRKTIVIDTEGVPHAKDFKLKIKYFPDLYIFWNNLMKKRYSFPNSKTISVVGGCPRTDFLIEPFRNLFPSRSEILKEYGLPESNFTITISTAADYYFLSRDKLKGMQKRHSSMVEKLIDYDVLVNNMGNLFNIVLEFVKMIDSEYNGINVIIKPHPNEDITFWTDYINRQNNKNIVLMAGRPINYLLKVSDFHVSFNSCTTTLEAMISNVPNIEIHDENSSLIYEDDHLLLSGNIAFNAGDLKNAFNNVYKKNKDKPTNASMNFQTYITKYYHKVDGNRCLKYSNIIEQFIEGNSNQVEPKLSLLVYKFKYLFWKIKSTIMYILLECKILLSREKKNSKPLSINKFDTRIKQGDESCWYVKFEELL